MIIYNYVFSVKGICGFLSPISRSLQVNIVNWTFNSWNTSREIQFLKYIFWNTVLEIHLLKYISWNTSLEIHLLKYISWNTSFEIHLLTYISWNTSVEKYFISGIVFILLLNWIMPESAWSTKGPGSEGILLISIHQPKIHF